MANHEQGKQVDAFTDAARTYCDFVEAGAVGLPMDQRLRVAAVLLARLYAAGLELPDLDPGEEWEEPSTSRSELEWPGLGKHESYWELFDPYVLDEPVATTLSDDLLDVYNDVRLGLVLLDVNGPEALAKAVWTWRFLQGVHWGNHAVDALRALQRAIHADP